MKEYNGVTYLDTPGLADIKLRQQAAEAITKALKQDGTYQIFFVITLEAGRIRPEDMTTIKLVLESASDIEYYSIIINKLSKVAYNCLVQDNAKQLKILVAEMIEQVNWKKTPPTILLLLYKMELHDAEDQVIKWEELDKFAKEAPCMTVTPASVVDINGDPSSFQKVMEMLMQEIVELRNDNKRMMELQKDTEEKYCKLLQIRSKEEEVTFFVCFSAIFYLSLYFFSFFFNYYEIKIEKRTNYSRKMV